MKRLKRDLWLILDHLTRAIERRLEAIQASREDD